ncbi:endonuclease MutS2 [Chloroflexota bacterium]
MDDNSLEMLEFPKIVEMLADYTSFSASRELAFDLRPSSDPDKVLLWLKQSAEARRLLSIKPEFSVGNSYDIREATATAAKGKILEPKMLLTIKDTLGASRIVRSNIGKLSAELPALWDIGQRIIAQRNLEDDINQCITETGEVSDNASARLANLRQQLKDSRQRLLDRLGAMLKSKNREKFIQEAYVTEREGRYVIPVKAEFRREIKGIIHDISNTGATVFVEPWATVELGNDLRQYIIEEQREVEVILGNLSSQIGANDNEISNNIALLAEIDLILAKARFAERMNATEPTISVNESAGVGIGILRLVKARHPLLKDKAVPLNVEIGKEFSTLVITGPNAGGKTVALKTIGLLSAMALAGMPIPASEESCIPLFEGIFADIGDQQSIEQTLSTFSWHVSNIVSIIRNSNNGSLVLLDELGISTDPNEGTALAKAILLYFLGKGTMSVTTTHYSELKAFAHVTSGVRNASLDFDPVTFAPTYHLTVGIPGGSNALSIALRLGLLEEIIDTAKDMMSKESYEIQSLMADMLSEKQKYEAMRDDIEKESHEIENLKNHLEGESQRLKEQEKKLFQETRDTLLENAAELQRAIRRVETELRKERKRESIERSKKVLDSVYEQLEKQPFHTGTGSIFEGDKDVSISDFSPGDQVRILGENLVGKVLSLVDDGKQLEIQIGNTKLQVGIKGVEKLESGAGEEAYKCRVLSKSKGGKSASLELDLRGKRADEVPAELDKYLNDAFLASLGRVRIIHGYATGTVRQIVRQNLESHPLVKSFEPGDKEEGGDGVTVAYL